MAIGSKPSLADQSVNQMLLAPYSLGYRIRVLTLMIGRSLQQKLEPYGLTPFHWVVLCCLWQQDGMTVSEIVSRLTQVGGTMTGVLSRMEERALIYREQDARDRRIWRVWLTETGRQLEQELPLLVDETRQRALVDFSDRERQQLSDLVDRAIANLSDG